jgi:ribonuclease HII
MKNFDNSYLTGNVRNIAGTDEAGRGPLAGPVVAAAVIFASDVLIEGVNDSKKLSESQRERIYPLILEKCLSCSVSVVSNEEIDRINILQASLLAMRNSVDGLTVVPDIILVDGNKGLNHSVKSIPVIKGDSKSFAIASASIIAKVTRDSIMKELSLLHPQYLWGKNKGYPTKEHIALVKEFGPSRYHRVTFLKNFFTKEYLLSYCHPRPQIIGDPMNGQDSILNYDPKPEAV